jgi:hypothetical protein
MVFQILSKITPFGGNFLPHNIELTERKIFFPSLVKQDAISGLLQSGIISTPQQVAALQQQLAALTVGGGMSVPLPPVNVTQVPLFKTTNDSSLFEMQTLLQSLPPWPHPPLLLVRLPTWMAWSAFSGRSRGSTGP